MTPELVRADRDASVRAAARAWQRVGIIDAAAAAAIGARHPDDRVRAGPVFRVLLFLFTVGAIAGMFGFVALAASGHEGALAGLAAAAGAGLLALTEVQTGALRRRQGGTEAATCVMGIGFLLGAAAWLLWGPGGTEMKGAPIVLCLAAAALCGGAAWRWGYPVAAAAAAAAALLAVAQLPAGRLLWIALPLATAPGLLRASRSPRLPAAHRASTMAALVVALAALYLAVHLGSWDARLIERALDRRLWGAPVPVPAGFREPLRQAAAVATGLLPLLILGAGVARRSLPLLLAGAAAVAVSLATLVVYAGLGPDWLVLIGSGAMGIAVSLGLARFLASGPEGERGGFTVAPLAPLGGDERRAALLEAGATAVTTIGAGALAGGPPAGDGAPRFHGGGGRGGGGGASGEF